MSKISIELTKAQLGELLLVAGNGYGDGDFYNNTRREKYHKAFLKAYKIIAEKLKLKHTHP